MTPRDFLKVRREYRRLFAADRVSGLVRVGEADRVGVVLLIHGGPDGPAGVRSYLYSRLMDPATTAGRVGGLSRHVISRLLSSLRAPGHWRKLDEIGGASPENRHVEEQATSLASFLTKELAPADIRFTTYVAARHGHPGVLEAYRKMERDGVDKVVILPLQPHYTAGLAGSALAQLGTLRESGRIPDLPVGIVGSYGTHPGLIEALSDRIAQGLQRFRRESRCNVHLLFVAPGHAEDGFCDRGRFKAVVETVDRVVAYREDERPVHVALSGEPVSRKDALPRVADVLRKISDDSDACVLVVPTTVLSDTFFSAYDLDIRLRAQSRALGIRQFEVASGLNCHPLLIQTLAELVIGTLEPEDGTIRIALRSTVDLRTPGSSSERGLAGESFGVS